MCRAALIPNPQSRTAWIESAAAHPRLRSAARRIHIFRLRASTSPTWDQRSHVPPAQRFLAISCPAPSLLTPHLKKVRVDPAAIRSALCAEIEAPVLQEIQETLDRAQIPPAKQARARDTILRERLSSQRIRGIWLLRPASWRELLGTTEPRAHSPSTPGAGRRSRHSVPVVDPGLVHGWLKCFKRRTGPWLAVSLGAAVADLGPTARPHYAIARLGRNRRRRAFEATPLLRIAAPRSRQPPPSRRGATPGTRARIGGSGSAGPQRRISRLGRAHRNRRRNLRAGIRRGRSARKRRFSCCGFWSRPGSRGAISNAAATGPTCASG